MAPGHTTSAASLEVDALETQLNMMPTLTAPIGTQTVASCTVLKHSSTPRLLSRPTFCSTFTAIVYCMLSVVKGDLPAAPTCTNHRCRDIDIHCAERAAFGLHMQSISKFDMLHITSKAMKLYHWLDWQAPSHLRWAPNSCTPPWITESSCQAWVSLQHMPRSKA